MVAIFAGGEEAVVIRSSLDSVRRRRKAADWARYTGGERRSSFEILVGGSIDVAVIFLLSLSISGPEEGREDAGMLAHLEELPRLGISHAFAEAQEFVHAGRRHGGRNE